MDGVVATGSANETPATNRNRSIEQSHEISLDNLCFFLLVGNTGDDGRAERRLPQVSSGGNCVERAHFRQTGADVVRNVDESWRGS